jgi:hypothetical protein
VRSASEGDVSRSFRCGGVRVVGAAEREAWVVGFERVLHDVGRSPQHRLGLVVTVLGGQQCGEVIERDRDLAMVGSQRALEDLEDVLQQRPGVVVVSDRVEDCGERRAIGRDVEMIWPERPFTDLDGSARGFLGRPIVAAGVGEPADVVEQRRDGGMVASELSFGDRERASVMLARVVELARVLERDASSQSDRPSVRSVHRTRPRSAASFSFIESSDYLDNDVAALKDELIVHPEPADGGMAFSYEFALAPARTPALA